MPKTLARQSSIGELPGIRQHISVDASNFLGGTEKAFLENAAKATDSIGHASMALQLKYEQEANEYLAMQEKEYHQQNKQMK